MWHEVRVVVIDKHLRRECTVCVCSDVVKAKHGRGIRALEGGGDVAPTVTVADGLQDVTWVNTADGFAVKQHAVLVRLVLVGVVSEPVKPQHLVRSAGAPEVAPVGHVIGPGIDKNFGCERGVGIGGDVREPERGCGRGALVHGGDVPDTDTVAD